MTIGAIMFPQAIVLDKKFDSKESLLEYLASLLTEQGCVMDKGGYLSAVYEREKLGSTYIGHGIAIPHGKSDAVAKTGIAFVRIPLGLDYDGNGDLAKMVFMIAAPSESDNEHLKVLSMLARKLMHEENRRALMDAVNGQEVIKVFDDEEAD